MFNTCDAEESKSVGGGHNTSQITLEKKKQQPGLTVANALSCLQP